MWLNKCQKKQILEQSPTLVKFLKTFFLPNFIDDDDDEDVVVVVVVVVES